MLHLVKPAEGGGLDILVSATAVPSDDERLRLAAVMRYEILDTAPEAACDRITALAADLFNVPISIIGFVDRDRIWFKSHHGLDATEIERDTALLMSQLDDRLAAGANPAGRGTCFTVAFPHG